MRLRQRLGKTVLVAASGGLVAFALPAQQDTSQALTLKPWTFQVSGVAVAAELGRLVVPANRTAPSKATINLAFVRIRSTALEPGAPIVFLAGGPGDAGTQAIRRMPTAFLDDLLAIGDLIAIDQRGTGMSGPGSMLCPPGTQWPMDEPTDTAAVLKELRTRVATCLADVGRRGVDVRGLTTTESADDIEALRIALAAPQFSLYAGSYGTHLALVTTRRHRGAISRMALLGVEGPDHTLKLPSRVDTVLARIAAARYPSLLHDIDALRTRLAKSPMSAVYPSDRRVTFGEWDVMRFIFESLDTGREIDRLLQAIPEMLSGNFRGMGSGVGFRVARPLNLMNLAMDCASYASTERLAQIRRDIPRATLGEAINFPVPQLCGVAGLPRLPDDFRTPVISDVPTLLVSGTFDGRTPVENAVEIAQTLPNAQQLIIDGASHDVFGRPEAMRAVLEFFRGGLSEAQRRAPVYRRPPPN